MKTSGVHCDGGSYSLKFPLLDHMMADAAKLGS